MRSDYQFQITYLLPEWYSISQNTIIEIPKYPISYYVYPLASLIYILINRTEYHKVNHNHLTSFSYCTTSYSLENNKIIKPDNHNLTFYLPTDTAATLNNALSLSFSPVTAAVGGS